MHRRRIGAAALALALAVGLTACYVPNDFDGDNRADVAWMLPTGDWYRAGHADPIFSSGTTASQQPVAGDYDGNHTWEPAVEVGDGTWISGGRRGTFSFPAPPNQSQGVNNAPTFLVPVPADYDGNGTTDPAWYRQSDATWWIEGQSGPITYGTPHPSDRCSLDYSVPVPADYDGDGKADLAVYEPGSSSFRIGGQPGAVALGSPYDIPAVADYDGDGKADLAVIHPGTGPADPSTFLVAGRDPVALPIDLSTTSEILPMPANYDGTAGDELAFGYKQASQQIWVAGAGATPVPTNATPIAGAASVLALPQLLFGRRNACATVGVP